MTPERFDIYDDQQNWIGTSLRPRSMPKDIGTVHSTAGSCVTKASSDGFFFSGGVILRIPSPDVTTLQQEAILYRR